MTRKLLPILSTLAFAGSIAFAQTAPPPATAPVQPPAAQGQRQPPPPGGGMLQGMRPGMQQGRPGMHAGMQSRRKGHSNFRGGGEMHRPGGGGDFRGGRGGFAGGGEGFRGGAGGFGGGPGGGMGGAFHIAPAGMWWKNPGIVQKLTLSVEQTKKMDDIFQASRIQLIDLKANVEKQNAILEPMLSANPPDTAKALAQIDKVAQARAELEKGDAKMLLGIRGVLTPDQWTKLHTGGPGATGGPGPGQPPAPGGAGASARPNGAQNNGPGGYGGGGGGYGRGGGYGGGRGGPGGGDTVAPNQ
jgi:Spy/CpxP family protein refolding chaperone